MEKRISDIEVKMELVEFKIDLHNKDINRLTLAIESLVKIIDTLKEKDNETNNMVRKIINQIKYYLQATVVLILISQFGLLKVVGAFFGVK